MLRVGGRAQHSSPDAIGGEVDLGALLKGRRPLVGDRVSEPPVGSWVLHVVQERQVDEVDAALVCLQVAALVKALAYVRGLTRHREELIVRELGRISGSR